MNANLADEILTRLVRQDPQSLRDYCLDLVRQGLPIEDLIREGLAPAMHEVGLLWERGVWSVADEHLATSATKQVLALISAEASLAAVGSRAESATHTGSVIVACVEGDWHSLPARMVAEVLADQGWSVKYLGASQPTPDLVSFVRRDQPQAVLLSCTMPAQLPAMAHAVNEIKALNVPVFVGGRALGLDSRRAVAMGADGWAGDASGAAQLLRADRPKHSCSDTSDALNRYQVQRCANDSWARNSMRQIQSGAHCEVLRPWVHHILDVAYIGLLVDDRRLILDECTWLSGYLATHAMPDDTLDSVLAALVDQAPRLKGDVLAADVVLHLEMARCEVHKRQAHSTLQQSPA